MLKNKTRSQEFKKFLKPNGAIYIATVKRLLKYKEFYNKKINVMSLKEDIKEDRFTKKIIKSSSKISAIIKAGGGMSAWRKYKKIGCQSWLVGIELLDPRISFDFLKALKKKTIIFLKNLEQKIENLFLKRLRNLVGIYL